MPSLDPRGKIAAAQVAFYTPVAALTAFLIYRYAFRRDAGWFWLFIFSAVRIANAALVIAGQLLSKTNLLVAAYVLEYVGLAPLLLSSIGFIGMAGQHTYAENPRFVVLLRMLGLLGLVGLALSIAGGVLGSPTSPSHNKVGLKLREAAAGIYAGFFVIDVLAHIGAWTYRWQLRSYRRNLLWGISAALPFLGARVAYSILATWSSSDLFGTIPSKNPALAHFNPILGNWVPYLVLGPLMEFLVTFIYMLSSTVLARRHHY